MKSTVEDGALPNEETLRRFLRGDLEPAQVEALELRMERSPELAARLGELARERSEGLQGFTIDRSDARISLSTGEGPRSRRGRRRRRLDEVLTLGPIIGEGGMGVVHLGRQHSVDREVAIKTVRTPDSPSDLLLEEAYLMGQLEHPNIVPIHDITVSDDGRPQVVLKRIEGRAWRDVMRESDETVKARHGVVDLLAWHLGVFLQVCQAVRFAHSRGIVHRDIKPDNVMIGPFDDVYLLDWGLGLSLDAAAPGPTLETEKGIAGTPAYMAPEQLEASPAGVGTHTDVYLLGATLHEIVTGRPPQDGKTLAEIRDQIATRDHVALPETCPAELAAIIRRALSREADARFESVRALREAVERFLEHRTSEALADTGDERSLALRRAQRRRDEGLAERAFVEGTFSYRMALDAWPDNERARHGLNDMVEHRVRQLLALKAPRAAKRALAVADAPLTALADEVDEALANEDVERAYFAKLKRDDDRRVGHEYRRALAAFFGAVWIAGGPTSPRIRPPRRCRWSSRPWCSWPSARP